MALSDHNILITPNIGASNDPTITFVGADASNNATITLRVINSGTIGTLSFEGSSGQLLSITDTFDGTIFSVNDISGIPSIEVLDTGEIILAEYSGFVNVKSTTNATSTTTGALVVTGGVGIGKELYVGGEIKGLSEITAYYSDRRLKENIVIISDAINKIKKLNGITYTPNKLAESFGYDPSKKIVGLFADEVESVLPEAVKPAPFDLDQYGNSRSGENYKTIQYEKIVPLLVEAIKEQQVILDQILLELKNLTNK